MSKERNGWQLGKQLYIRRMEEFIKWKQAADGGMKVGVGRKGWGSRLVIRCRSRKERRGQQL